MKENQRVEWKETWRDEYLRWICGFANAEGGVLVIGRNDKGVVAGLTNAEKLLDDIPNKDYASGIPAQISVYDNKLMMWNPGQLPLDWSLDRLLAKHASQPANPDIANAFFRAGKIESWGRGIDLIRNTCLEQGYPVPRFNCDSNGLWVEFPFPQSVSDSVIPESIEALGKTTQKTTQKITQKILDVLAVNPSFSRREIAKSLGDISEDSVKYHLEKLKASGRIRRIGPDKGGYWEVVK